MATCRGSKTLGQYLIFEPLEHHYLHRLLFEEKLQLVEDSILNLAHDVANAMQYLHNMGFLHCYLGSQSVMVTRDYTAKVTIWLWKLPLTLSRREGTFNILLCLTPDDFTCQCGESRRERVNLKHNTYITHYHSSISTLTRKSSGARHSKITSV